MKKSMEPDEKNMEDLKKSTEGQRKSTEHSTFFISAHAKLNQACQFFLTSSNDFQRMLKQIHWSSTKKVACSIYFYRYTDI